jgi:hypothetical protein
MDREQEQEEMDISTAISPEPGSQPDLLSVGSPTSELPNPNRFELSRDRSSHESGRIGGGSIRSMSIHGGSYNNLDGASDEGRDLAASWATLPPGATAGRSRSQLHIDSRKRASHKKRQSLSHRRGSSAFIFGGDDLEGDLGYAAAEEMEGNERKVIVERLEAVKSKNPVFSCC